MSLAAGLSADSVFARERAYSGYGNTKAPTSGHARSSVTGTLANALGSSLSDSSGDSEARGDAEDESDTAAGDELRETGTAASFRAVPRAAAAAGGASARLPVPLGCTSRLPLSPRRSLPTSGSFCLASRSPFDGLLALY